jgi:spore coat protein A
MSIPKAQKGYISLLIGLLDPLEPRRLLAAAAPGLLDPLLVPKYVNALPNALSPGFIYQPVSGNHYAVGAYPITQNLGLGLDPATHQPLLTKLFGYGTSATTATYPGRTFVARTDVPITVTWSNGLWNPDLPGSPLMLDQHFVRTFDGQGNNVAAVDYSLFDPDHVPMMGIPIVPHLHGGHNESASDGLPGQWFTPPVDANGDPIEVGPDYVKRIFTYDNDNAASTLWYHDHAMGVTRLGAYAGMAGFYLVRDQYDTGGADNAWGLPYGNYEIPIAVQDKMFTDSGELFYPTAVAARPETREELDPSILPEMFGDTIVVNGKAWPFLNVEPRKYRFHLLNGSDSRFYNFYVPHPELPGRNVPIIQIGTEQGILNTPATLSTLRLAPGQRADVIIDFRGLEGTTLILRNNAKTPFPRGSAADPQTTGQIMQFRVGMSVTQPDNPIPGTLRGGANQPPTIAPLTPTIDPVTGQGKTRQLALFEVEDEFDRVTPMLGTVADGPRAFMSPVTEKPHLNDTEIWEIYNTTADAHPIHVHLVAFQLMSRQKFGFQIDEQTNGIVPGSLRLHGQPSGPAANEAGWLDTVQINPGDVARIIAKFDRPGQYVWHCHILSHEEHDMMRPFEVIAGTSSRSGFFRDGRQDAFGSSPLFAGNLRMSELVLGTTANLQPGEAFSKEILTWLPPLTA